MTGHTVGRLSIIIWRYVTPMLLILTFSSILTVGILDGFRYEVWTHRSVSIQHIFVQPNFSYTKLINLNIHFYKVF